MTNHPPSSENERRQELRDAKSEISRTLDAIATIIGRLVYITSFRDDVTGFRKDSGLAGLDQAEIERLLAETHAEVIGEWLNLSLRDQYEELRRYLVSLRCGKERQIESWLTVDSYLELIPATATGAEKDLFRLDLELVLKVLKDEFTQS